MSKPLLLQESRSNLSHNHNMANFNYRYLSVEGCHKGLASEAAPDTTVDLRGYEHLRSFIRKTAP
jgi:hypothetical protein